MAEKNTYSSLPFINIMNNVKKQSGQTSLFFNLY